MELAEKFIRYREDYTVNNTEIEGFGTAPVILNLATVYGKGGMAQRLFGTTTGFFAAPSGSEWLNLTNVGEIGGK